MPEPTPLLIRKAEAGDLADVLALYAQPDIDDGDVLTREEASRILDRFARYPDYTLSMSPSRTAASSAALRSW